MLISVLGIGVALPCLGQSQEHALVGLLSGKAYPLTVQLKDLTSDWRKVTVHSAAIVSDNVSVNVNGGGNAANSQNNLVGSLSGTRAYLTQGETMSACGRSFLVAYRVPGSTFDLGVLLKAMATKVPSSTTKLTPESSLTLSLLDVASLGTLDDIHPFDMQAEIAESETAARAIGDLFKSQAGTTTTNAPPSPKNTSEK
jgi:hypothetical protein